MSVYENCKKPCVTSNKMIRENVYQPSYPFRQSLHIFCLGSFGTPYDDMVIFEHGFSNSIQIASIFLEATISLLNHVRTVLNMSNIDNKDRDIFFIQSSNNQAYQGLISCCCNREKRQSKPQTE